MPVRARPLAAAFLLAICAASAQGQTIVASTFGPGDTYDPGLGWSAYNFPFPTQGSPRGGMSVSFQPSLSGTLSTIRVPVYDTFGAGGSGPFDLSLYDGAISPANLLESFVGSQVGGFPSSILTFNSSVHPLLNAGHSYWLAMLMAPGAYGGYAWMQSYQTTATPPMQWYSLWTGYTWQPYGLPQTGGRPVGLPTFEIAVDVVNTTPEPATLGLIATGLLGVAAAARRRRRA